MVEMTTPYRWGRLIVGLLVALFSIACGFLPTPMSTSPPTSTPMPTSTPPPTATLPAPTSTPVPSSFGAWQATVDALAALQQSLEFPEHFADENAARTGDEFDANEYFTILDHLSMKPGYVLDYVYCYDGMGGYPILYARPEDQARYSTCSDYDRAESFMEYVQTDDTEEGFFQFVLLYVMGGQFYLFWHANYYDDVVVCDLETIESIVSADDDFGYPFSDEQKEAARAIDVAPIVEMGDDAVVVKVVVFSKWGGFSRATLKVKRAFPHTILESEREVLVEYDCGIMF